MNEKYNVYLVSDSTGETLDRIFLSLKSQFANFEYEKKEFAFIRTENQIDKIIKQIMSKSNMKKALNILSKGPKKNKKSFSRLVQNLDEFFLFDEKYIKINAVKTVFNSR